MSLVDRIKAKIIKGRNRENSALQMALIWQDHTGRVPKAGLRRRHGYREGRRTIEHGRKVMLRGGRGKSGL